jgi:hypothetical protein
MPKSAHVGTAEPTHSKAATASAEAAGGAWWRDAAAACTIVGLVVVTKLPTLHVPAYWDEMAWFGQARWLAAGSVLRALPGWREPWKFFGHPTGLHATFAAVAAVFGPTLVVAHVLVALFAGVGVWFTYRLGATLFDARTGGLAAFALLTAPLWFAQAGMFLADLPAAALGVASVHFSLRRSHVAYLACASYMMLLKETTIALIGALLVWRALVCGDAWTRQGRHRLALLAAAFVPITAFALLQRLETGSYFFIFDPRIFDVQLFQISPAMLRQQLGSVTTWIFVAQHRWIFTTAIVASLLVDRAAWRRRELALFALIGLGSGYSFVGLYFLPRYLMPVLPFFYLVGGWAVTRLAARTRHTTVVIAAVAIASASSLLLTPFASNGEVDLHYLDVVRAHRAIASTIASAYGGARVLTAWPHTSELTQPHLGWVAAPLPVVSLPPRLAAAQRGAVIASLAPDLILVSPFPPTDGMSELRDYAIGHGWTMVRREAVGPVVSELYARP